jgi:hypothetical protein
MMYVGELFYGWLKSNNVFNARFLTGKSVSRTTCSTRGSSGFATGEVIIQLDGKYVRMNT